MSASTLPRGQSLQLLLTGLISGLVLLTALAVGFFYHQTLKQQLLSAQQDLFHATAGQITGNINDYRGAAITALNQVNLSGLTQSYGHEDRAAFIPHLVSALSVNPSLQAIYLGYMNGDFFLVRRLDAISRQAFPAARPNARWLAQFVTQHPDGRSEQTIRFLDQELQATQPDEHHDNKPYDPRQRPWYLQAITTHDAVGTNPYRFASTGQLGITYAIRSQDYQAIAGVDIRLSTLRDVLQRNLPSRNSDMAIINDQHQVLVTATVSDNAKVPMLMENFPDASIAALGRAWPIGAAMPASITANGEKMHISMTLLNRNQPDGPKLLMLMPEQDLFATGQQITRDAMWIPAFILLLMLPLGWLVSRKLSKPLHRLVMASERIQNMDFSDEPLPRGPVRELNELMAASESMKDTIRDFIGLSRQIVSESDLEPLLEKVLISAMRALPAQSAGLWLQGENGLQASHGVNQQGETLALGPLESEHPLLQQCLQQQKLCLSANDPFLPPALQTLCDGHTRQLVVLPLQLDAQSLLGVLVMSSAESNAELQASHRIHYLQALASFAAIAIDNRRLAANLQQLMNALIKLIAGAIDAKSPYTGGHCQRVPDLAQALAEAAHQCQNGALAEFSLDSTSREALYIASWLHDCGKVTTPEYVVDKATKLETLFDRIHEIRTRFEVLKRDVEIDYWKRLAAGEDEVLLRHSRDARLAQLDDDFAFVARCNQGGEFMLDEDIQRLEQIARKTWLRTLDDRLGLGPMELERLAGIPAATLPVSEPLLSDKPEHRIHRDEANSAESMRQWGFNMKVPELQYHRGELYNLKIRRGTLTEEERFKINEHITETIKMLRALPFPRHLRDVPEIAGGHHERMDGKGYPCGLKGEDMSVLARVMAIADVFEALTASDRPYKPAKSLSEALRILQKMAEEGHVDPDLYSLFLTSGIWQQYARRYLDPVQHDIEDAIAFLPRLPQTASQTVK